MTASLLDDLFADDDNNLSHPGGGLAAYLLSSLTLRALQKKGTLSGQQANEIIEVALLSLETHQASGAGTEASKEACRYARRILENLRKIQGAT